MRYTSSKPRSAYTLLEITLALAIAILLLGSMYYAFSIFIVQTEAGRQVVSETEELRAVWLKLSDDISSQLGPLDTRAVQLPQSFYDAAMDSPTTDSSTPDASSPSGTTGSSSTGSSPSTGSTSSGSKTGSTGSSTGTGSTGSSSTPTSGTSSSQPATDGTYAYFNVGVKGTAQQLTLYVGKVPDYKLALKTGNMANTDLTDLRRVSYWIVQGANGAAGLARQETKVPTSADALSSTPFDGPDQEQYIISDKVVQIAFQYYDGNTWSDIWNGSEFQSDGKTPYGPPRAIQVELTVKTGLSVDGEPQTKKYLHTIIIPTANGVAQQN